ncbi:class I SAM-dependent methyltransferase [Sciscionella sediminilitoris]|uniref:class I SAM-dependent methyltransferase n=1 Tax=Sciscionella sediminilitoris TaxID=1445613 RepID=UPI0004DFC256|nr:class I SAM-dependent methyltransferase [Sciscionella sp. SE31]
MGKRESVYAGARAHYLSPKRRDPVKRLAEEPVSRTLLREAVAGLGHHGPVRVLDLGCGTGDGLDLLSGVPHAVQYTGLDSDADMVHTAAELHPDARFVRGDLRGPLPEGEFELYMSSGVPYSHLPADQIEQALRGIFERVRETGKPAALLADVLGRYSIEWLPNWGRTRWDYAMTFFEGESAPAGEPMTFLAGEDFAAVVRNAASSAGVRLADTRFTDRSVLLGRHTATRTFNPHIPPYRKLVNDLHSGTETGGFERLFFDPPRKGAPPAVLEFFTELASRWNGIVRAAIDQEQPGTALAEELLRCERDNRSGLGVGHSLIASMRVLP